MSYELTDDGLHYLRCDSDGGCVSQVTVAYGGVGRLLRIAGESGWGAINPDLSLARVLCPYHAGAVWASRAGSPAQWR